MNTSGVPAAGPVERSADSADRLADQGARWHDALLAAAVFAIDPPGLGGVALRAPPGAARDRWFAYLRELLPPAAPVVRVPVHVADDRLLGGLDLAATLRAGRPVVDRGVLAAADGGIAVLAMAERLAPGTAARIAAVLDAGEIVLERDGLADRSATRFAVVAFDEGIEPDERVPAALLERLTFHLDLADLAHRDLVRVECAAPAAIAAARARLGAVVAADEAVETLCAVAAALGIGSLRAPLAAVRVARVAAALAGRGEVGEADIAVAARLVLAPRATVFPATEPPQDQESPAPDPGDEAEQSPLENDRLLEDVVLEAALAALPPDLLAQLRLGGGPRRRARSRGRAGVLHTAAARGRPAGVRRGEPRAGVRLNVVETLRAAAPWQRLRQRTRGARVVVRRDDFRVTRYKHRDQSTTIFVVDASGSSALHRLAEAKGAVELLLADCYVRRDHVALVAFRGPGAELILPPTRSLVRAKRTLGGLPGGGGTPLAAGLDAAVALAEATRRRGETPIVVLLTDGRANIARDGTPGRAPGEADALAAARAMRAAGLTVLLVDTSPRPRAEAERLAAEMDARYLPLPYADASVVSRAVLAAVT